MVYFKCFNEGSITILDNKSDTIDKGTTLNVEDPLSGKWTRSIPLLDDSFHPAHWTAKSSQELVRGDTAEVLLMTYSLHETTDVSDSFVLLKHRLLEGQVQWGSLFRPVTELLFCPGYWEWLEDVLSRNRKVLKQARIYDAVFASLFSYDRHASVMKAFFEFWCTTANTLHTSIGEFSISLWDLHRIGGLSVHGNIYDEVIPSATEMTGTNDQNKLHIPASYRYLFCAFHLLCKKSKKDNVKINSWIDFWFKGSIKYVKSTKKAARNKTHWPKETHNPSSVIPPFRPRSKKAVEVFDQLGVKEDLRDETNLAAFLACWLCKFILPVGNGDIIRPSVFKVASMIACGEEFSLAIPVLASIYRGLNDIVSSFEPGKCCPSFPTHYVYAWLAEYFDTHFHHPDSPLTPRMTRYAGERMAKHFEDSEAYGLFTSCKDMKMHHLALDKKHSDVLIDDGKLSFTDHEYFVSMRSSYLTLRSSSGLIMEPYSPHRFSRQFGYYQDTPGKLKADYRTGSLEKIYLYWESSIRSKTQSAFQLPDTSTFQMFYTTMSYVKWWSNLYDDLFAESSIVMVGNKRRISPKHTPVKASQKEVVDLAPTPLARPKKIGHYQVLTAMSGSANGDSGDDRSWKHRGKQSSTKSRNNDNIIFNDVDTFLADVPSSSYPISAKELLAYDFENRDDLACADDSSDTETSARGPSYFDLVTRKDRSSLNTSIAPASNFCGSSSGKNLACIGVTPTDHDINIQVVKAAKDQIPMVAPTLPEASTYNTGAMIVNARRKAALALGDHIKKMLIRSPLDKVLLLKPKLEELYSELSNFAVDFSALKSRVEAYLQGVSQYVDIQAEYAQAMTSEVQSQHLAIIGKRLAEVTNLESMTVGQVQLLRENLSSVEHRQSELRKELEHLDVQAQQLRSSIEDGDLQVQQRKEAIVTLKAEQTSIEAAFVIKPGEIESVAKMEKLLQDELQEIQDLAWLS